MKVDPKIPGTLLVGRYHIVRLIRAGGMGRAYEAKDMGRKGKRVIVKELTDTFDSSLDRQIGIRNFLAEVQVLSSLYHPNIPRMLDHFFDGDNFYFVMELLEGIDLGSLLEERHRTGFPPEEVVYWGIEVCKVLEYLHRFNPPLIHRDLKPSNLIWQEDNGKLYVIDFGIARVAKPALGYMIGSLGYASPEQHENNVGTRSDIYSLGVTLHELLTGIKPGSDQFDFTPPVSYRNDISQELSDIVMTALAYFPENRWEDAAKMREALENIDEYSSVASRYYSTSNVKNINKNFTFNLAAKEYIASNLIPALHELRTQYLNECQTGWIPKEFVHFELTIGMITPFKFIVTIDEDEEKIIFLQQEGILAPTILGAINPCVKAEWERDKDFIGSFKKHYEETSPMRGFIAGE